MSTLLGFPLKNSFAIDVNSAVSSKPTLKSTPLIQKQLNVDVFSKFLSLRQDILVLAEKKNNADLKEIDASQVGFVLFHESNYFFTQKIDPLLTKIIEDNDIEGLTQILSFIESPALHGADALFFKPVLDRFLNSPLYPNNKSRIDADLQDMQKIEQMYSAELPQNFLTLQNPRGLTIPREKWNEYIQFLEEHGHSYTDLKKRYKKIYDGLSTQRSAFSNEFGYKLPEKTLLLTFDDGPHKTYTSKIQAILKDRQISALFFQLGQNIGSNGIVFNKAIDTEQSLAKDNMYLANHSYSHAQLSKATDAQLFFEIKEPHKLLQTLPEPAKQHVLPYFRFPYGAQNPKAGPIFEELNIHSMLWNIDSKDWADPIARSVHDRVMTEVSRNKKGIILFHDIHPQTVAALPSILDDLLAQGYRFMSPSELITKPGTVKDPEKDTKAQVKLPIQKALIIGINDYYNGWPKLSTAQQDAQALSQLLTSKFYFKKQDVKVLTGREATRENILKAFDAINQKTEEEGSQLFIYFAGHGDTVTSENNKQYGYVIPADAVPGKSPVSAISMQELRTIANSMRFKHVLFVMDSCYSGLGLSRGSSALKVENDKRKSIQIITAGGAFQQVADSGWNGHSIFSGFLLDGLNGNADLNKDSFVSATELAAYLVPKVSAVSLQTPAFGNLPGSEGGDFLLAIDKTAKNEATPVSAPGKEASLALNAKALSFYKEGNYESAKELFKQALALDAGNVEAINNLGFIYFKQKNYAESIYWFEVSLKEEPTRIITYLNMADALFEKGDVEKAIKYYRHFVKLKPEAAPNIEIALNKKGLSLKQQF